jgi:hypothetical protein
MNHYVYVCLADGVVRYVGMSCAKGEARFSGHMSEARIHLSGRRVSQNRWVQHLAMAMSLGLDVGFYRIITGLTRDEAWMYEGQEIRRVSDQLWNSVLQYHPYVAHEQAVKNHHDGMKLAAARPGALQKDPEYMRQLALRGDVQKAQQLSKTPEAVVKQKSAMIKWASQNKLDEVQRQRWADPDFRARVLATRKITLADRKARKQNQL